MRRWESQTNYLCYCLNTCYSSPARDLLLFRRLAVATLRAGQTGGTQIAMRGCTNRTPIAHCRHCTLCNRAPRQRPWGPEAVGVGPEGVHGEEPHISQGACELASAIRSHQEATTGTRSASLRSRRSHRGPNTLCCTLQRQRLSRARAFLGGRRYCGMEQSTCE